MPHIEPSRDAAATALLAEVGGEVAWAGQGGTLLIGPAEPAARPIPSARPSGPSPAIRATWRSSATGPRRWRTAGCCR